MFFIINKTRKKIVVKDIGIKLGPRQAVDLDKILGRERTERSKDLIREIRDGIIEIKRKDEIEKFKLKEEKNFFSDHNKEKIIKEIRQEVKQMGKDILKGISSPKENLNIEDIKKVMKEVITSMPQSSNTVIMKEVERQLERDEKVEIDPKLLSSIHERAVNELVKETEMGAISYTEEKVKEPLEEKVEELEKLLD